MRISLDVSRCLLQDTRCPLIKTHAAGLRCNQGSTVNSRINAQHQFATGWLLRCFANLGTGLDVVINRLMEGGAQISDVVSMEADKIINTEQFSNKDAVILVKINAACVALVSDGVNGVTPINTKKSRTSTTWYALASFAGCGR